MNKESMERAGSLKGTLAGGSLVLLALVLTTAPALAGEQIPDGSKPYSPYVGRDFPINVYFGDTHLHTRLSLDAYVRVEIKDHSCLLMGRAVKNEGGGRCES